MSRFTGKMRAIVELFIRSIHLIAAIVWFGAIVFSTFIAMPIMQKNLLTQNLLAIHNRFRNLIRFTIHILLITGAMVFFIVASNNDMRFDANYMLPFVAKLAAFGLMTLFWGLYASLYQKHLETTVPNGERRYPRHINLLRVLTLIAG